MFHISRCKTFEVETRIHEVWLYEPINNASPLRSSSLTTQDALLFVFPGLLPVEARRLSPRHPQLLSLLCWTQLHPPTVGLGDYTTFEGPLVASEDKHIYVFRYPVCIFQRLRMLAYLCGRVCSSAFHSVCAERLWTTEGACISCAGRVSRSSRRSGVNSGQG